MIGTAIQDYLKAIYKLQRQAETVSTSALAEKLGTSPAAITKMVKQLAERHMVTYTPYYGVRLTLSGEKNALEVIRHHRLLEQYLMQAMGYRWDEVDAEAEKLEHVISEEFEARMDALLGYPETCPHGDPIPRIDGTIIETLYQPLSECTPGEIVTISRVKDTDAEVLRALSARHMLLRTQLTIVRRETIDNLLTIQVADQEQIIGPALAQSVFVAPVIFSKE